MKKQKKEKVEKPKKERKKRVVKKKEVEAVPKIQSEVPATEPEQPTEQPQQIEQPIIEEWQKLNSEQRERLLFKYGARVVDTDLEGTKDDVAQKIADKTGEAMGEVRKFID